MDDTRLPGVTENAPQNCLDDPARRLNGPSEAQIRPADVKPVTDAEYENARRKAEKTYQLAMVEWLGMALAEAEKVSLPKLDALKILAQTWSAAWRGETPATVQDSRARVPSALILTLSQICEEFLKSELRAYLGLLERSGVPASQRLTRLERESEEILAETRARKWNRTIEERIPAVFLSEEPWLIRSWGIVEDAIKEFVRNDLEFEFWVTEDLPDEEPTMDSNAQDAQQQPPTKIEARNLNSREAVVLPILKRNGWSIHDWADKSGLDHHTLFNFLRGTTQSFRSTRAKIANSLGISVDQLPL